MPHSDRVKIFRALHERDCFVLPNPWDIGTTRWLRRMGAKALATTSAGFAHSRALSDGAVPREAMLAHIAEIVETAVDLPVNADFENGYADTPEGVGESVRACLATGVAGLSIEDSTGDRAKPLFDLDVALERLRAAREAVDASGTGVLLTGRAECFLTRHEEPLKEAARRIEAYAAAGADVLYAPGVRTAEEIATIVSAAGGKPVNVLMYGQNAMTVSDVAALGVRRISIGSALAAAAWAAFIRASNALLNEGSFAGFTANAEAGQLNKVFMQDLAERTRSA